MKSSKLSIFPAFCIALCGNALALEFWDNEIVFGHVRTEYAPMLGVLDHPMTLRYEEEGSEGCLFDSVDAFSGCPGRAGLPENAREMDVWLGTLQWNEACGGNRNLYEDTWEGCIAYRQSNFFETNATHANYWMLTANNDPSFDQCNTGMPGVSHPVVGFSSEERGIFRFQVEPYATGAGDVRHRFHLAIDSKGHDFFCASQGGYQSSLPFLSIGAQNGAGTDGVIGVLDKSNASARQDLLQFNYEVVDHSPYSCLPETRETCLDSYAGAHSGFFLLADWDGINRMLFVELWLSGHFAEQTRGPEAGNWNWPIEESVYFPGAEIATLPVGHPDVELCELGIEPYTEADMGSPKNYRVNISDLYICADALGLFSSEMPENPIEIDGVHWFSETYGTNGYLWVAVDSILIDEEDQTTSDWPEATQPPEVITPITSVDEIRQ